MTTTPAHQPPAHQRPAAQRPGRQRTARPLLAAPLPAEPLWCPDCHDLRDFVPVPCAEGHLDCPDRACVDCGAAVFSPVEVVHDPTPAAAVA
ncbi:MAG TPA: hypothetical protein VK894_03195 [Jiangellales bacterium]|nr:hypothetical protein [Jiangellales bacterium]